MLLLLRFLTFFNVFFQNPKKSLILLTFLCHVAYVFSNYGRHIYPHNTSMLQTDGLTSDIKEQYCALLCIASHGKTRHHLISVTLIFAAN